jgi:hypothetical protein
VVQRGAFSAPDEYDPYYMQGSGLLFENDEYVTGLSPFVLSTSYTFSTWLKPDRRRDVLPVFTKMRGEEDKISEYSFNLFLSNPAAAFERTINFWFNTQTAGSYIATNTTIPSDAWSHLGVVVSYTAPNSTIDFYINGNLTESHVQPGAFWDDYFYNYYIGTDMESNFGGIIRDIKFENFANPDFSADLSTVCTGTCTSCPASG